MRHRRGRTIWLRGGGTAWTHGDCTMSRTPVVNICEDGVDLEQQVLVVTIGCLLLKRWRSMTNSLVMVMWLGGTAQGLSEGMMLMSRQRNMSNRISRINRSDRTLTPRQLWKPIATKHHENGVEHRDEVNQMSREPSEERCTDPQHFLITLHKPTSVHHQVQKWEGHHRNLKEQTSGPKGKTPEMEPVEWSRIRNQHKPGRGIRDKKHVGLRTTGGRANRVGVTQSTTPPCWT